MNCFHGFLFNIGAQNVIQSKNKPPSWITRCQQPAIKNRFFHIDLKGPKIPLNVFLSLLEQVARWGINGVIVEYEHRLPYLPLPKQFPVYERYKESEIKILLEKAASLGIEWIPLVQTFGHVEYLSKVKGTENLFENPDYPSQLCPSKKIVRQYIQDLIIYAGFIQKADTFTLVWMKHVSLVFAMSAQRKWKSSVIKWVFILSMLSLYGKRF